MSSMYDNAMCLYVSSNKVITYYIVYKASEAAELEWL
jgi:hypothetical protein